MMRTYLTHLWSASFADNTNHIVGLLEPNPDAVMLDVGCDDGHLTVRFARKVKPRELHGVDLLPASVRRAAKRGILTKQADVNGRLPYPGTHFDVVVSNQVIEHLFDTDRFVEEIWRVLKPGGYAVISTENLSSWHNIFALVLGRPAFSQHVSSRQQIGNAMSLVTGRKFSPGWFHVKIFTLVGLQALMRLHRFTIERSRGAGYYPVPVWPARFLARISPGHSAFIAVKGRKPPRR